MSQVILWLFLLIFNPVSPTEPDAPNNDYFSIGAHLNADSFGKYLRRWLDSHLQVEAFKEDLQYQRWKTQKLDLATVQNLTSQLDERVAQLADLFPELVAPMTGSYISCHSIHELVRLTPTQPCAIRVSDTGTPPKYKLDPLLHSLIHRQFVLSEDVLFEFPAEFLPPRIHSNPILASLLPFRKNIVLLLDTGSLRTQEQIDMVRLAANQLLEVVSYYDQFTVYVTAGSTIRRIGCRQEPVLLKGERQNLDEYKAAIHNLEPPSSPEPTDHGSVIAQMINLFDESNGDKNIMTYVSRGVLQNLEDAATAVKDVTEAIGRAKNPVRINTIILSEDKRSTSVWSSQFMDNLAKRTSTRNETNYVEGISLAVEKNLMLDLYDVQELLDWQDQPITENVVITLPSTNLRTITMTKYWFKNESDVIAGIEIPLSTLLSPIFHNSSLNQPGIQAHLVTEDGLIIASSAGWEDVPLSEVDSWRPASKWLEHSWQADSGELEVVREKNNATVYYLWSKLKTIPGILIISSEGKPFPRFRRYLQPEKKISSRLEHLLPHATIKESVIRCSQYMKEIIPGVASLYFPPYISSLSVSDHWIYLTDTIGMTPNRGLIPGLREQVNVLNILVDHWVKADNDDEQVVLQKFIATSDGVLVVYPAVEIARKFDPKKQEWFVEAMKKPNVIVITGPRQDPQLGDIVIVSIAVEHKKENFAVLAVEIPASYLGKLLKESVTSCSETRQCILFSRSGRVVFSDKVYASTDVVEKFHISHLEPILTSDMTANSKLVKKTLCQHGTVTRRQFEWNTEYLRVHTTLCGDVKRGGSVSSEVLVVPGSQFLLVMINTTCIRSPVTVFCPCSVHDGRCLFCGKFDSLECECPCSCPGCVDRTLPHCPITSNNDMIVVTSSIKDVPSCGRIECPSFLHYDSCIASPSCSWCQYSQSLERLIHPQCRAVSTCYNGVIGRSLYKSVDNLQQTKWLTPTPIGPLVAGFVLSLVAVIVTIWCYRNYVQRDSVDNCNHSIDSTPLFGPTTEMDCDPTVFKEERVPVQLTFFEREVVREREVPPPPSDHGYSTMTEKNDDTTSAVSTAITDQSSSLLSKPVRRLEPTFQPMTSLITMAEVYEEPPIHGQLIC